MKKILIIATTALLGASAIVFGALPFASKPLEAYAETSEPAVVDAQEPVVEKASWIEEKIIPIIGSFSVANLVGIIVTIATAITKTVGDKSVKKQLEGALERINGFEEKIAELKEHHAQEIEKLASTEMDIEKFVELAKLLKETLDSQTEEIEGVAEMKETLDALCSLIAKALSLSKEAVKSGIAKDAQRLIVSLNGGISDGEE